MRETEQLLQQFQFARAVTDANGFFGNSLKRHTYIPGGVWTDMLQASDTFFPWVAGMGTSFRYNHEVEAQLRNMELRNALEPYNDDSVNKNMLSHLSLDAENEYLFDILEWEKAPLKPIYRWFNPPLCPPRPDRISNEDLPGILDCILQKLYEKHIVLEFTDHLSDRELYRVIWRNILPCEVKMIYTQKYMSWDCAHINGDPDVWLRYYASPEEREIWAETYQQPLPPMEIPKYPRHLPEKPEMDV